MAILQGSSYEMPVVIRDSAGNVIDDTVVAKGSFTFGDLKKTYGDGGDVYFNPESGAWIIPLSEEETFSLKETVKWQARFLFFDGTVDGTVPKSEYVYDSINFDILGGGSDA